MIFDEPLSKKPATLIVAKDINAESTAIQETATAAAPKKRDKKKGEQVGIYSKATLFVSTIPFDATKEDLELFFSQIGPVRSCFLVKKEGKSTGCGFVQFAVPDDAQKAVIELKKKKFLEKRTLKLAFAVLKGVAEERKKAGIPLDAEKREEERKAKELALVQKKIKVVPVGPGRLPSKSLSKKLENSVTIQLSELPFSLTKSILNKKVRKFGTVKEIEFQDGSTSAKIIYSSSQEAKNALKHLDQHIYKGAKIACAIVETITAASIAKRGRLIIRNLSFSCKKEHLIQVFEVFGTIADCSVPLTSGKSKGFGFIQFESVDDATKAIEQMNGQKILGRPVAIDWAIGKSQYNILSAAEEAASVIEESKSEGSSALPPSSSNAATQETMDGDDAHDSCSSDVSSISNSCSNEEDDAAIIFSDAESEAEAADDIKFVEPEQDSTLFIRNLSFETSKEALKSLFRKWGILNYAVITMDRITGVSRGNGFVCFKSAEDAAKCLKDYEEAVKLAESMGFSASAISSFGNTGLITADHPPKSSLLPSLPESSQEATKAFMLDGRLVSVTLAVSKQVAEKISQASTLSRRATDKRHLYLMREGVVFPGSEASKELTSQELEHCTAQYANKKRLLATNPNLFISRTRLSIRGIPAKVTDQELRLKAKEAVKTFWNEVDGGNRGAMEPEVIEEELSEKRPPPGSGRKVVVKQAKIIKETDRLDATTKKPKSKGYGFIEFISHADALACLRVLNNQRNVFTSATLTAGTKTKRVVVEFAVENQLVLKKRQSRNSNTTGKEKSSKSSDQKAKRKAADMEVEGDGGKKKHKKSNDALSVEKKVSKFKERREKRAAKVLEKREGKENITPLPVPVSDKVKKSRTEKEKTKKRKPVLPGSAPDSFDLLLTQYSRKKLRS